MNYNELVAQIEKKRSFLCIGLDTDITKIPPHLLQCEDPQFEFNKGIIDATHDLVIAYKPNVAFYESRGSAGWKSLEKTAAYLKANYPDIFRIADAKRGDIGNTSKMYAKAFFEHMDFDAVTVAPYMGSDSVQPFLEFKGKWVILLALTSNTGAGDFQHIVSKKTECELHEHVLIASGVWGGNKDNMMYVVGATQAQALNGIRDIIPNNFLLVPGVGAQGGSLEDVVKHGMNDSCGLIINSSREIIYASKGEDFVQAARKVAIEKYQQPMQAILKPSTMTAREC